MFQILLILAIPLSLSISAFANDIDQQDLSPATTSPEASDSSTPNALDGSDKLDMPNEINEVDEADEDIKDDVQLLDREFSDYGSLLDRRFGFLLGIGQTSPRHDFHLEAIYAPFKFLRLSLSFDTTHRNKPDREQAMAAVALRARHHLTILPIFFGVITGGTKDSIKGLFQRDNGDVDYSFSATTIYGGLLVGAYYFWNFGLYLETTIAGFSFHHAITKNATSHDTNDTEDIERSISDALIGGKLFGLLNGVNGGINIAIGYMF